MNIKKWVMDRWITKFIYKTKFYIDVALSQVNWIIGKGPELMAAIYFLEKGGINFSIQQIAGLVITIIILAIIGGMTWYKLGLYDAEIFVKADKHPITKLMLKAAKIIISKEKGEDDEMVQKNSKKQNSEEKLPKKNGRLHQRQQHPKQSTNAVAHLLKRPTRIILRPR